MHTKLTRFLTITVLALVLGSATAAPVAAQSPTQGRTTTADAYVVCTSETVTIDREAQTVTVTTMTYWSDGTWNRVVETWSYIED